MGRISCKKWICGLLAAVCCLSFSSCNYLNSDMDGMLRPPKPTGELYEIQQALEKNVVGGILLKYPQTGDYRSAFILHDSDGDGEDEALAFYILESEQADKTAKLHVSLIDRADGVWKPMTELLLSGTVNQVSFADLDGDGRDEILIGWTQYTTLEKKLSAYTLREGGLIQRIQENYTQYAVCNLIPGRSQPQLLLFNLSTADKAASAKLISLGMSGVQEEGTVSLDGTVTSYQAPRAGRLKDGTPAVYVDAYKGTAAMITEIVYYTEVIQESEENLQPMSRLVSPFHDNVTRVNDITRRPAAVSRDVDGDGVLEMPLMTPLPGYDSTADSEKLYLTTWRNYDGKRFTNVYSAFMDYENEYFLRFPSQWQGDSTVNVTVGAQSSNKQRSFYVWNPVGKNREEELLTIQLVSEQEWEARDREEWAGYIELAHRSDLYYVGKIIASTGVYALTEQTLRECFGLIS